MTQSSADLIKRADQAAGQGHLGEARKLLDSALESGTSDIDLWLKLAAVCRGQGDLEAALNATDKGLKLQPLHFLALMLRANLLEKLGNAEADEAYGRALAQSPSAGMPPALGTMIEHARQRYNAYRHTIDDNIAALLGSNDAQTTPEERARLTRCRTNATRLTQVYHAEPTDYHYPGLREREFHERASFEWLPMLEAATEQIAEEFARVVGAEQAELIPYIQYEEGQPLRQWAALNQSRDWTAIHLLRNGIRNEANARHCPTTMSIVEQLPMPKIAGASPNVMFSLLAPRTHIPPHNGIANTRLVCHLPLIIPQGCWFRVGAERREWKMGEAWVFDDTIEHEAMNESDALRVILILDVWHPDLNSREQKGIAKLVEAHGKLTG